MRFALQILLLAVALAMPLHSSAQEARADGGVADADELQRARALFEQAQAALEAGDMQTAEAQFRASYEAAPRASTALNLALVLHEQGHVREALDLYEELQSRWNDSLPTSREQLEALVNEARDDLAYIRVRVTERGEMDLRVDGVSVGSLRDRLEVQVPVDPGTHRVEVQRAGGVRQLREVEVAKGATEEVVFDSIVAPSPAPSAVPDEPDEPAPLATPHPQETPQGDSGDATWWWVAAAGAAVVVAGVITTFLLVNRSGGEPYDEGPVPRVSALELRWGR